MSSEAVATTAAAPIEEAVEPVVKLFVGNLAYKTTTESLQAEFSSVGELLTCDVIVRLAGQRTRSLGYGFISYKTQEEADAAVAKYNHQEFEGRELNVQVALEPKEKKPKAKKAPKEPKEEPTEGTDPKEPKATKKPRQKRVKKPVERSESDTLVFVANLSFDVDDEGLGAIFADYKVKSVNLVKRYNGRSKGFGFVDLETPEEQVRAILGLNGSMDHEREIVVKVALDKEAVKKPEGETTADGDEAVAPAEEAKDE